MFTLRINQGDSVEISPVSQIKEFNSFTGTVEMIDMPKIQIQSAFSKKDQKRMSETRLFWLCFNKDLIRYKASFNRCLSKRGAQYIEFRLQDEGEALQKRNFYRHSCDISTVFTLLETNETGQITVKDSYNGVINNMSGGGIKLHSEIKLSVKDSIIVHLKLDDENLLLFGEIRVKYINSAGDQQHQYGVMFSNISDADQDKIIKFLFRQQNSRVKVKRA